MLLDTPTILINLVLVNIMSATAIFWAWIEHPTVGQRKWSLSMIVESLGLMLVAAQNTLPVAIAIIGGYTCLSGAFVFRYLSLSEFFERRAHLVWVVLPLMVSVAVTGIFLNQPDVRIPAINLIICVQSALLLYIASTSTLPGVNYSRMMLIVYAVAASAIFLFRGIAELAADSARVSVMENSLVNSVTFTMLLLLVVLSSFSILLILREKLDAENQKLATLDPLTNICNRRALIELTERELLRSYRTNRWPCLLMLDIDHFKEVNDQHGHLVGDQVLVELANLIKEQLRDLDVVGRYGGEEFCILLAETDENGGLVSAERLREAIEKLVVTTDETSVTITASIGLAFAHSGDTLDQLLARADTALYQAKTQGRNSVVIATV
ncbi:MAG: GGDEF domain-containing protein [Pseudohongiellaceae bacterium]